MEWFHIPSYLSDPTPLLMQANPHPFENSLKTEGADSTKLTSGCATDPTEARRSSIASMAPGWMMTASELWREEVATCSFRSFLGGYTGGVETE